MWSSPDKPLNDTFAWKRYHVRILLDYDMEFEPSSEVFEAIEYLRGHSSAVRLHEEAIMRNNQDLLLIAKERLKVAYARYL